MAHASRPSLRAHACAPRLRIVVDVELEGPVTLGISFVGARDAGVKRRCWDWARNRRGLEAGLEELLAAVDRVAA